MAKSFFRRSISRCVTSFILCMLAVLTAVSLVHGAGPLRVNPANPRYFVDSAGSPVYLAGTYLAHEQLALGQEDFGAYLDFLQSEKHNLTRLWAWEQTPATAQSPITILPYLRTGPGQALDGGAKFDLLQFNQNHFDQLRARVIEAAQRGVYVSVVLFQSLESSSKKKQDKPWYRNPFNRDNNINNINGDPDGNGTGDEAYNLTIPAITSLQEAYLRKVVDTLNDLDNVLYELSGDGSLGNAAWQNYIITYLKNYQATKTTQHPVGVSYSDGKEADEIFAGPADWIIAYGADLKPPVAEGGKVLFLEMNPRMLNRSSSTAGFWKAFTRGFNVIEKEFDSFSPSVSESLHTTIAQLVAYSEIINLASMISSDAACSTHYCLVNPGNEYLIYLPSGNRLWIDLSTTQQDFLPTWFDPKSGQTIDGNPIRGGAQTTIQASFRGPAMLHMVQTATLGVATLVNTNNIASASGTTSKKTTVATPTITPNGGSFAGSTLVSLADSTSGTSIYFTTDGTTPSQSSTRYTGPITISSDTLLQARAFKSNANPSAIVGAQFTKAKPFDFSLANSGNLSVVAGNSVNNTITASLISGTSQVTSSVSALPAGATATLSAASCNPTCSTVLGIRTSATTPAGNFPITITSTGGGVTRTTAFTLTVTPPVLSSIATPTISPNGGSFTNSTLVTMATSTSGAAIYYTTDGSSPTQSSTLYTGGITLTATAVVKAKAFKSGYNPSAEASASFSSNLVAYWKFDEGTGTTAKDSSGNGNTGTLTNGPLWTQGRIGSALYFDGADDTVIVPDSNSLDLSNAFTLSAWVNPSQAFTDFRAILVKNYSYYLYANAAGYCGDGTPLSGFEQPTSNIVCQSTSLVPNTWTHLAATYNGSTLTLYRDGLPVAVANASGALAPTAGSLQIGASQFGEFFKGMIDEVRIYKTALNDSDILTIFQQDSIVPVPTVAAPAISPNGGNYGGPVTIAMQTATAGAQIYYTTDGSTPTTSSTPYSGSMTVTSTTVIKAKAFKNGYNGSGETGASFVISQPFGFSLTNSGNQSVVAGASVTNTVSTTLDSGTSQTVSFSVSGLPTGATASFSSSSCSPACSTVLNISTAASTTAGSYPITVSSSGGSVTKTTTFTLAVSLALTVATPTITPNGASFSDSVSVAMQSTTSGATIYYTTDGSIPTQSSIAYTGAMTLASSATVNAKAFKSGYSPSPIASASFVKNSTGNTYYVATNGSDSNPGTLGSPFRTIAKGVSVLRGGDTLYIRGGIYAEALLWPTGGTQGAPTTISRYQSEIVTIRPPSDNGLIKNGQTSTQAWIIFDGLVVDGANAGTGFVNGFSICCHETGPSHITFQNGEIKNFYGNGAEIFAEFITIRNTKIHDNALNGDYGPPHGLYISCHDGCLFEHNEVYNNGFYGFHVYDSGQSNVTNNIIRYNSVHHNGLKGSTPISPGGVHNAGILVSSGSNNQVYSNLVYANGTGPDSIYAGGIQVAYGCDNCAVYNNTVYGNNGVGIQIWNSSGVLVRNNITTNNVYTAIDNQGSGTVMSNNMTTDPKFIDSLSSNFHLQSGSAAIDSGFNLLSSGVSADLSGVSRPQGAGFDIGAYEYVP